MSGGRCVSCGLLTETITLANEEYRVSILRDLKAIGRKRGFRVTRGDKDYTICAECVDDLVKRSQPKGKK